MFCHILKYDKLLYCFGKYSAAAQCIAAKILKWTTKEYFCNVSIIVPKFPKLADIKHDTQLKIYSCGHSLSFYCLSIGLSRV